MGLPGGRDFPEVVELENRLHELHGRAASLARELEAAQRGGPDAYWRNQVLRVIKGQDIEEPVAKHREKATIQRELAIIKAAIPEAERCLQEARRTASVVVMEQASPMYRKHAAKLKKALLAADAAYNDMQAIRRHFRENELVMLDTPESPYVPNLPVFWASELEKRGY